MEQVQLKRGSIMFGYRRRVVLVHKPNNRWEDDECCIGTSLVMPISCEIGEYFEFWHLNDETSLGRSVLLSHINNIKRTWT